MTLFASIAAQSCATGPDMMGRIMMGRMMMRRPGASA
jgi:hypothetical protein